MSGLMLLNLCPNSPAAPLVINPKYRYLLCRLCLRNSGTLCDIYCIQVEHGFTAAGAISDLLQCNVSVTDGYPQLVCLDCMNKLYIFKKFKERCKNAKAKFEMSLQSNMIFLHVPNSVEKTNTQKVTSFERSESHLPNIQKRKADALVEQHVEGSEFTSEFVIKNEPAEEADAEEELQDNGLKDPLSLSPLHAVDYKESSCRSISTNLYTDETMKENDLPIKEENTEESNEEFGKVDRDEQTAGNSLGSSETHSLLLGIPITQSNGEPYNNYNNQEELHQNTKVMPLRNEIRKEEEEYLCRICRKSFNNTREFHQHIKTHVNIKYFECEKCKKCFNWSCELKRHISHKHGEKPFKCEMCPRMFAKEIALASHRKIHTGQRAFKCKFCIRAFCYEKSLKKHSALHAGDVPFQCSQCGKKFDHKWKIASHIRHFHLSTPYVCSICRREFAFESTFMNHMTIHTGEKNFMCEICGKTFRVQSNLKIHSRVHTGERPYHCELCNGRFTQRSSLVTHMKLHNRQSF